MYALSRMYFVNSFDFLSSCLATKCLNGGVCMNTSSIFRCSCPRLYNGPFCQFDANDTNYEWNTLEVAIFFFVVFMVAFAIAIVCCASSNHMGFYISVPAKHYNRWEEDEDMFDSVTDGEQIMAMANIRKGIVVSRTRETVLADNEDSGMLQL
ncbi:unnamed protein product [Caenorhabditis bovis]|uniref:EGF-like domain-containing protein n=1 Tax=Caenorhabditis bovis TaxID=2654633 RepID=A0A8S1EJF3_9PELO|nr:unnamed protein product [Caenorhabditis bovis]